MLRKQLRFYGWVQGVGFRYRARYAAQAHGVTGWVCNLADGSVLMEMQGEECDMDAVILAIEQGRYIRIENFSCKSLPLQEERGFVVRYDEDCDGK